MAFELDLTNDTEETLNSGGLVPAGWYQGIVDEGYEDDEKGDFVFKVKLKTGGAKGAVLTYRVYDPDQGEDEGKQEWRAKHAKTMLKRLGCINSADLGKVVSINPAASIGRDMICRVVHEEFKGKTSAKIQSYDLYERDNPGVPPEVRAAFGLPELEEHKQQREMKEGKEAKKAGKGQRGAKTSGGAGQMAGAGANNAMDVSDL